MRAPSLPVLGVAVIALLLLLPHRGESARELLQTLPAGHCGAPSRCADYCQGFGKTYDGILAAAHCELTKDGEKKSCVAGVSECIHSRKSDKYAAQGCFCCCVETNGQRLEPDSKREEGPLCGGWSSCETYCSRFGGGMVANKCVEGESGKTYCASNYLGFPSTCAHTSSSEALDSGCNCCCNPVHT